MTYTTSDSIILPFINSLQSESLITKGKLLHSADYEVEALRIVRIMRNNGFANFRKSYFNPADRYIRNQY